VNLEMAVEYDAVVDIVDEVDVMDEVDNLLR